MQSSGCCCWLGGGGVRLPCQDQEEPAVSLPRHPGPAHRKTLPAQPVTCQPWANGHSAQLQLCPQSWGAEAGGRPPNPPASGREGDESATPQAGLCRVLLHQGQDRPRSRGVPRPDSAGAPGPLTFGGLRHGRGEAVHVVAAVAVVAEQQLVLSGREETKAGQGGEPRLFPSAPSPPPSPGAGLVLVGGAQAGPGQGSDRRKR